MAKDHTFDIDLDEWELIPEDPTLLCFTHGSAGKRFPAGKDPSFRSRVVSAGAGAGAGDFDSPILTSCPPAIFLGDSEPTKDIVVVKPAAANEYKDIGVVLPPLPELKKMEENEFADLKMKVDCAPKAILTTTTQMELQAVDQKKPSLSEEEEQQQEEDEVPEEVEEVVKKAGDGDGHRLEQKSCLDGIGINISGWRLARIGAICSIGTVAAAATICVIVVLGGQQRARNQNRDQNLQLQVYGGDEGAARHVSKLNQAMAAAAVSAASPPPGDTSTGFKNTLVGHGGF